jgi:hypothetical protein
MTRTRRKGIALGGLLASLLLAATAQAQGGSKRVVRGQVLDANDKVVASAIVHLKNTSTKEVFSVATNQEGRYQFNDVDMKFDYEIYAEQGEQKSRLRKISQFDTRPIVRINLQLEPEETEDEDEKKEEKS